MTLDELKLQVSQDLKVDDEHLDTESLKNQEIKAKWLDYKSRFELLLVKNGSTMVVNLTQRFMQQNHLTSKF